MRIKSSPVISEAEFNTIHKLKSLNVPSQAIAETVKRSSSAIVRVLRAPDWDAFLAAKKAFANELKKIAEQKRLAKLGKREMEVNHTHNSEKAEEMEDKDTEDQVLPLLREISESLRTLISFEQGKADWRARKAEENRTYARPGSGLNRVSGAR